MFHNTKDNAYFFGEQFDLYKEGLNLINISTFPPKNIFKSLSMYIITCMYHLTMCIVKASTRNTLSIDHIASIVVKL